MKEADGLSGDNLMTAICEFARMTELTSEPLVAPFMPPRLSPGIDSRSVDDLMERPQKVVATNVNFFYGLHQALHNISLSIPQNCVTALIGPSGCGKSTF